MIAGLCIGLLVASGIAYALYRAGLLSFKTKLPTILPPK
jgi:hypothetical protein